MKVVTPPNSTGNPGVHRRFYWSLWCLRFLFSKSVRLAIHGCRTPNQFTDMTTGTAVAGGLLWLLAKGPTAVGAMA
jgi:hypothetical protein